MGLVAQKFRLDPGLTVAGLIHRETGEPTWRAEQQTRALLAKSGVELSERARVGGLTRPELALAESIRLWADGTADVALLDEASAMLNMKELSQLHWIVDQIRDQGRGVVYVSNRLGEIQQVADRMLMLRDGVLHDMGDDSSQYEEMLSSGTKRHTHSAIATPPPRVHVAAMPTPASQPEVAEAQPARAEVTTEEIDPRLQDAASRAESEPSQTDLADATTSAAGEANSQSAATQPQVVDNATAKRYWKEALDVKGLSCAGVSEATFSVAPGQIVGLLGERKSGMHEFIQALTGRMPPKHGVVEVFGRRVSLASTDDAALAGIGWYEPDVTPELIGKSLVAGQVPDGNLAQASEPYVAALQALDSADETFVELFGLQSPGERASRLLSLLLLTEAPIAVLEEPTASLDQKARDQLFQEMCAARERGMAILVLTSEVEELISWTDRILVFESGRLTNIWDSNTVTSVRVNEVLTGGGVPPSAPQSMTRTPTQSAEDRPKVTNAGLGWITSAGSSSEPQNSQ